MVANSIKRIVTATLIAAFSAGFVFPSFAGAPKPYNSAQLKYLFEGSEIESDEGTCFASDGASAPGNLTFMLRFGEKNKFLGSLGCDTTQYWIEKNSGSWRVKNNELCLTAPPNIQFWKGLPSENCWKIVRWSFGFAALDSRGNEDWTMSLISHPKHFSKEELYVAMDKIEENISTYSSSPNRHKTPSVNLDRQQPMKNGTINERLRLLKKLVGEGLITPDEATVKRNQILDSL